MRALRLMGRARARRRLGSTTTLLALTMAFALAVGGTALADELVVDGDGLVPVATSAMNLGSICLGQSTSGNALLAIRRTGQGQLNNVFSNGSTVTVSAGTPSGDATVSTAFIDNGIALSSTWTGAGNNAMSSDTAISSVTVNTTGTTVGAKAASVVYTASGTRASDGNPLSRNATLTINWSVIACDTTPPVITPNVAGTLGDNGWYVSDVNVSWSVTDAESAVSSTTGCDPVTINADTAGQTLTCSATSLGGTNSASVTIMRDATPPTINGSATPGPNGNGWNNSAVTVSFACADDLSGVASCGPDETLTGDGAGQSASGTAVDNAGNSASATVGDINIDTTAPSVSASASPAPNANGWNNGNVTVSFSGSDSGSGIAACDGDVVLSSEGAGQSATGSCADLAGNSASATASDIKIDKTAPSVSLVGGPADGASYPWGYVPAAPTCSATDALSGIDGSCSVSVYNTTVGTHTVTASATDKAGNSAAATATYTVTNWRLSGFYAPVDMGYLNTVKGGSTVPLKFEVFAGAIEREDTWVVASFSAVQVSCTTAEAQAPVEELAPAGSTVLRYDATSGQFIYNWKTPKLPGKCYKVTLTTQDGSSIVTNFKLS